MSRPPQATIAQDESGTPVFKAAADNHTTTFTYQQKWADNSETPTPHLPQPTKKAKTPMILHIKLGPNVVKELRCFDDDDPRALAVKFCNENSLPPDLAPVVQNMIQAQFSQADQQRTQPSQKSSVSKPRKTSPRASSPNREIGGPGANDPPQRLEPGLKMATSARSQAGSKQKAQKPKLVAKMNVNIAPSQSKELLMYEGEDPAEVAYRFYSENSLPPQLAEVITKQLMTAQEKYYHRKDKLSDSEAPAIKPETPGNDPPQPRNQPQPKQPEHKQPSTGPRSPDRVKSPSRPQPKLHVNTPPLISQNQRPVQPPGDTDSNEEASKAPSHHAVQGADSPGRGSPAGQSPGSGDKRDVDVAETYERWQNLMRSKRKIKQLDSEASSASPEGRSSFGRKSSKSSTRQPKKNVNPQGLYKLALKTLIPSTERSPRTTVISQPEWAEPSGQRKLHKREEQELVTRLYGDARHRKDRKDELSLYEVGVRNITEPEGLRRTPSPWRNDGEMADPMEALGEGRSAHRKERELLAQEKLRRENFTFKPAISEASKLLAESRRNRSTSPIHEKLYEHSKSIQKDRQLLQRIALEEACPFKPQFVTSPKTTKSGFLERVAEREQEARGKKITRKQQQQVQSTLDPLTGQKLFTPVITKDRYYNKLREEEAKVLTESRAMKLLERSGKAPEAWREIFEKLDHDRDGYISAQSIDMAGLDVKELEALMNVFDVIESENLRLDFLGFVQVLQETVSDDERNTLEATRSREGALGTPSKNGEDWRYRTESFTRSGADFRMRDKSPSGQKARPREAEQATRLNLTKHYQRLLSKKER